MVPPVLYDEYHTVVSRPLSSHSRAGQVSFMSLSRWGALVVVNVSVPVRCQDDALFRTEKPVRSQLRIEAF
jgi:hypothetical protein